MSVIVFANALCQISELPKAPEFDPAFEKLELPNGSAGNAVQKIVQDSSGYMWFATQGGLHRYDGKSFITYNSDPINQNTLISDYIEDIYIDKDGTMWISHWSGGGLTSFKPDEGKFTRYTEDPYDPTSISEGPTGCLAADIDGNIWVGGPDGVTRLDRETGKFTKYSHQPGDPNSLSDNQVRGIYLDSQGTLWVATGMPWVLDGKGGLNRYDAETDSFDRYMHDPDDPTSLSSNKVRAMFEDSKGNFWVGTAGDGLHLFDPGNGTFERFSYDPEDSNKLSMPFLKGTDLSNSNPWSHITSIFEDKNKRLWITAVYGGLNVYDPKRNINYHFEAGDGTDVLKTNFIWQTFQSDDGTIWIATGGDGQELYKVKENDFRFPFTQIEEIGDSSRVKRGILKDHDGDIWIVESPFTPDVIDPISRLWNITGGRVDSIKLKSTDPSASLSAFIGSISIDSSDNIWVGTTEGYYVGKKDNTEFEKFVPESAEPDNWWLAPILQSSSGDIWIPYWGHGVIRYDPQSEEYEIFEHVPDDPTSISGINVWAIHEDDEGYIWMGGGSPTPSYDTPLFLDRYDPKSKTFEPFITEILPYGLLSDLTFDINGNLWFNDWYYGLYKLDIETKDIQKFTASNSLLTGSRIQSIDQYPGGDIWISTDFELIAFDPINETFSIYDESHGISGGFANTNVGTMTKQGELLFARWGGYHSFNPEELLGEVKSKLPDLRITGFRLLNDNISSGVSGLTQSVLEKPIWKTEIIELESDENIFSFSVACFDFYEPESNTLQFMLEGYDLGWRSDLSDGETPSYIGIEPGNYTFRLRGANSLGVWNPEGISLKVVIHPPWYRSWWAYTFYVLAFIGTILAVDRIQRRRLLIQERQKNQERELEQAREIEQAYNKLKETQKQLIHSEKMASLGELTAGIAHEIQNPLNFVNNFSDVNSELIEELKEALKNNEMAEANELASDIDENEQKIKHHGKRAEEIVRSMLQHSRGGKSTKEDTDLNALCDEYLRLSYHGLRAKDKSFNAEFKLDVDKSLPNVNVVPQDIGRVLLNLVNNAFFAVNERKKTEGDDYNPTVTVKTENTGSHVEISVSDNGTGIPESTKDKIFQPFFTTKATGQGTGLGLSMSYDTITKGHAGELKVESTEGQGTTFIILLPI